MKNPIPLLVCCCLLLAVGPASGQYPWCADMDSITAEVVGGELILHHDLATYNCCPDSFTYTVEVSDQTIIVTEREVLTNPCFCLCCFNLSTTIEGLTPGVWSVVYRWLDDQESGWSEWDLTVDMGGGGKTDLVMEGRIEDSGCLANSGAADAVIGGPILEQNFPNPFNPGTTLVFVASDCRAVDLRIFDSAAVWCGLCWLGLQPNRVATRCSGTDATNGVDRSPRGCTSIAWKARTVGRPRGWFC